jgi:predicted metal-binding membrane protein
VTCTLRSEEGFIVADPASFERIILRDRAFMLFGLAAMAGLAWAYTVHLAVAMGDMAMPQVHPWSAMDFLMMFMMWAVMMTAMMLPSASPMILIFAAIQRRRRQAHNPAVATGLFALSYVVVWAGFSLAATGANWALHQGGLMAGMSGAVLPAIAGVMLVAAGVFQWTPLKNACLTRCRSPLAFLMTEWREGRRGALVMGVRHGIYCVLCCWALMSLLFVLGLMNLVWIAALAAVALVEKVAPGGIWISRALGVLLIAWGSWTITGSLT